METNIFYLINTYIYIYEIEVYVFDKNQFQFSICSEYSQFYVNIFLL